MESENFENESLWNTLSEEYQKALEVKNKSEKEIIDKNLRTIRIFISSTFRDFHNERNLLVTKVFPRLRDWCFKHGLYLVECDLRWGIPSYVSREETLITCFDEIERGRSECNNMNFFLGLIGERYGWIPKNDIITEHIKNRYNWINDSSVTMMEFIHGMIRTLTPNGLIMIRSSKFIECLPDQDKLDFVEDQSKSIKSLSLFKSFLMKKFSDQGLISFYEPVFQSIIFDKFIEKKRVLIKGLDIFEERVENYFKTCIENNLLKFVETCKLSNNDNFHKLMLRGYGKQCTIRHKSFLELFNYLKSIEKKELNETNPIVTLIGTAGIGKSTILSYCAKELERILGYEIFFHSVSCTSSSQHNEEIIERIYRFLNGKVVEKDNNDETCQKLSEIFINGVKNPDKDMYYIIIDGIDELYHDCSLSWIPKSTNKNIVIVLSTLIDYDAGSFFSKLLNSDRKLKQIKIEPMYKNELSSLVSKYLYNFGKKLDSDQMNYLMTFESSQNPLWLISACEELRIHGDYLTITKLILSLPSNIKDLNRMIIKRLMDQDSTNLLQYFLKVLIISRAGIWENIARDLLAFIMNYSETISNSKWFDTIRQLKGFLLIESIPLPLIKFRHRVMKEAIVEELNLENEIQKSLHFKMAKFFHPTLEKYNSLFLKDYVYHLFKCNARNLLIEFMRSKSSWTIFHQTFKRSTIFASMRCVNSIYYTTQINDNALIMCSFCSNQTGKLSLYLPNKNCCYYCGNMVKSADNENILSTCLQHKPLNPKLRNCALCEKITHNFKCEYVKICQICKTMTYPTRCSSLIKETDILFKSQLNFSINSNLQYLI